MSSGQTVCDLVITNGCMWLRTPTDLSNLHVSIQSVSMNHRLIGVEPITSVICVTRLSEEPKRYMADPETITPPIDVAKVRFRASTAKDGIAVWQLVSQAGTLELNTAYFYLVFCSEFKETCLVAECDNQIVGAIIGYRSPASADTIFCWQIGVLPAWQGQGLASKMLNAWADTSQRPWLRYVTATVAEDNAASERLFKRFAKAQDATCEVVPYFTSDLLAPGHAPEPLYRIGPLSPKLSATAIAVD